MKASPQSSYHKIKKSCVCVCVFVSLIALLHLLQVRPPPLLSLRVCVFMSVSLCNYSHFSPQNSHSCRFCQVDIGALVINNSVRFVWPPLGALACFEGGHLNLVKRRGRRGRRAAGGGKKKSNEEEEEEEEENQEKGTWERRPRSQSTS